MEPEILNGIAADYGTPVYVYDADRIIANYRAFVNAFDGLYPAVKILYAYKANTNLAICRLLNKEGCGADVVSCGELEIALKVGVSPGDIIYTNNSKTREELSYALENEVVINVDSLSELDLLAVIAREKDRRARISFRINPSVNPDTHPKIATGLKNSKFGIHIENDLAFNAYKSASEKDYIDIVGVHTHIGSQIKDMSSFVDAASKMMEFVSRLKRELDITLEFVDMGGGLGVSYEETSAGPNPSDLAGEVVPILKHWTCELGYEPELWIEPGRYMVADAGVLLCRVNSIKETPYANFVNVDAGFNTLVRPAMYDAYHEIRVVGKEDQPASKSYHIAGNVCESGDLFAKDRILPPIDEGDLLAIRYAGAYGFSMASTYNSRPLPSEVLIWNGSPREIRSRGTVADLLRGQSIPEGL